MNSESYMSPMVCVPARLVVVGVSCIVCVDLFIYFRSPKACRILFGLQGAARHWRFGKLYRGNVRRKMMPYRTALCLYSYSDFARCVLGCLLRMARARGWGGAGATLCAAALHVLCFATVT